MPFFRRRCKERTHGANAIDCTGNAAPSTPQEPSGSTLGIVVNCYGRRGLLEGVHAGRAPTLRTGLDETGGITGRHDDVFQNSGLVGGPQDTFSIGETLHPGYFIQDKLI